jgi:hypothetical protein
MGGAATGRKESLKSRWTRDEPSPAWMRLKGRKEEVFSCSADEAAQVGVVARIPCKLSIRAAVGEGALGWAILQFWRASRLHTPTDKPQLGLRCPGSFAAKRTVATPNPP